MIEKYGADPNVVPATNEQYREIKKIAIELGEEVPSFKTQKEAQDIIDKLNSKRRG